MKRAVIGILAHVDAGKTTLSEAMLYLSGVIRTQGRVDHRNTYLDTHELERERGITIFSKQARLRTEKLEITLLDTPGHVDFSAETERTLSVLDYAILVISASDGVQAHTETLWHLLERYHVPTFVFITKMDSGEWDRTALMRELSAILNSGCVELASPDAAEAIAMTDERVLEVYLESGQVAEADIARLIAERRVFPCFFGSGLKLDGVANLMEALETYTQAPAYSAAFGGRVYKIGHDKNGTRLTYIKLTGGSLSVREMLSYHPTVSEETMEEKITAIRLYSGEKFESVDKAEAGQVCVVTGLSRTYAGQGLGSEHAAEQPYLEPVLRYRLGLPMEEDPRLLLPKLRLIEEEEPLLHIVWNEQYGEIHAQIMGPVQTEILTREIERRCGVPVQFEDGRILYRETIDAPVEGVGHYEPLRHYAEVHLHLTPLPPGSGLQFDTNVSENVLDRNWQRLILTHLEEKQHRGVLTGSVLTDVKLTLVAGRAHLKHTQGGDFRESTYRAIRHGLMVARAAGHVVLLEPYYAFRLEVPLENVGRAITDILARYGSVDEHDSGDTAILTGRAPVSTIGEYAAEVASYTHGRGKFACRMGGYFPCHNTAEVVERMGYDPEADMDDPCGSVFCAHGGGFAVPWQEVTAYMHLEAMKPEREEELKPLDAPRVIQKNLDIDEKELEAIMEREFGPIRRRVYGQVKERRVIEARDTPQKRALYIIDGYNVIFDWEELSRIAKDDLAQARERLCDILANYQAFVKREMVVVFDAYNVKGAIERKFDYQGLHVVYTKEGELGDVYIARLVREIGRDYTVRCVTSDGLIQLQALSSGVLRMSSREFREEVLRTDAEITVMLSRLTEAADREAKAIRHTIRKTE